MHMPKHNAGSSITPVSVQLQAAELLFGANGRPHDYLQAALFRLLAVGFVGAAAENWVLKVLPAFSIDLADFLILDWTAVTNVYQTCSAAACAHHKLFSNLLFGLAKL